MLVNYMCFGFTVLVVELTKSPENQLFKRFHASWPNLNTAPNSLALWAWPANQHDWRFQHAESILLWAREMMLNGTFRQRDHREFLELTVAFLGGVVQRPHSGGRPPGIGFRMRKPGSTNQTRFMGIALHELKITMMHRQFAQTAVRRQQSKALCEYLVLIHAKYFLQARSAISAPRLDQLLWTDLHTYKALYPAGSLGANMADAALVSVLRHTSYLTQELVVFALWDKQLPTNLRRAMARKLIEMSPPANYQWQTGKTVLPDNFHRRFQLSALIGQRSWFLFHLLDAGTEWLHRPVRSWEDCSEYKRVGEFLGDLSVVNDATERCVKDITEYAEMAQDSAQRERILLVVNDHRNVFQERRMPLPRLTLSRLRVVSCYIVYIDIEICTGCLFLLFV
jgi:hypothetical protein